MDKETNDIRERVKRILADFLGVDLEDIETETLFTEDLHMKPTDLADFTVKLDEAGIDTTDVDFSEIETFGDLIDTLTSQI